MEGSACDHMFVFGKVENFFRDQKIGKRQDRKQMAKTDIKITRDSKVCIKQNKGEGRICHNFGL